MVVDFLIFCVAVAAAVALAPRAWRRVPAPLRDDAVRVGRELRRRSGATSLRLLMLQMLDEMRASVLPGISRTYVPNEMRFGLHPDDAARWGRYFAHMGEELQALMLREVRRRPDLYLRGELRVRVVEDACAQPGRPTFSAAIDHEPAPDADGDAATRPMAPWRAAAAPPKDEDETATAPELTGERWVLRPEDGPPVHVGEQVTIGRGREADVRFEGGPISRVHARVCVREGAARIVDLGSTNGTFVNDRRIDEATLGAGDVIRLGARVRLTVDRLDACGP